MSLEKALGYLEKAGYREHVIQLGESTATVAMAASSPNSSMAMVASPSSIAIISFKATPAPHSGRKTSLLSARCGSTTARARGNFPSEGWW